MNSSIKKRIASAFVAAIVLLSGCAGGAGSNVAETDEAPHLSLAQPIRDGMILAKDKPVRIWGEGFGKVKVKINGKKAVCLADSKGKWEAVLPAMQAGGPYTMSVSSGKEKINVRDVRVGNVVMIAGQSNIQFKLRESSTPQEEWSADSLIRSYTLPRIEPGEPYTPEDGWVALTKENAGLWSAMGYHIGKFLREKTGESVAIVNCYQGASIIEAWIPEENLNQERFSLPDEAKHFDHFYEPYLAWNVPGRLFHYSVEPMAPYTLNAVVWYQGESNTGTGEYSVYPSLAAEMIGDWRLAFEDQSLPFVVVQIADFDYRRDDAWKNLQDAQLLIPSLCSGVKVVPCADICESDNIHPKTKSVLSERIVDAILE